MEDQELQSKQTLLLEGKKVKQEVIHGKLKCGNGAALVYYAEDSAIPRRRQMRPSHHGAKERDINDVAYTVIRSSACSITCFAHSFVCCAVLAHALKRSVDSALMKKRPVNGN